jgi:ABC-2 type transport system ATP-binding protein
VANGLNGQAREHLDSHIDIMSIEDKADQGCLRITLGDNASDGSFLAEILLKNGFRLTMLKEEEIDLEDVFMGITKGITN